MPRSDEDPRFAELRRLGGAAYAAFLAAGYREWFATSGPHSTPYLLQKRVRPEDGKGTLYFVNVWVFDFAEYLPDRPVGYQPEVQFNTRAAVRTFDVELLGEDDVGAIEAFFASLYERMECEPYDPDD